MTKINLFQGDITRIKVDAIVNASDETLSGGGGVDLAIHNAAGKDLKLELDKLGRCGTGEVVFTKGYNLPSKFIIHTVGPVFSNNENDPVLLANCYKNSLGICKSNNVKSIAFPAISTGVFGYPKEEASKIALETVKKFIEEFPEDLDEVFFVVFDEENYKIYKSIIE